MKNTALKLILINDKICLDSEFTDNLLDNIEKKHYQSDIKFLIYLMLDIRSDISFAILILSQFIAFFRIKYTEDLNHVF